MRLLPCIFTILVVVSAKKGRNTKTIDYRILNGYEYEGDELVKAPYQAFVDFGRKESTDRCGGAVIAPRAILSAAHCFINEEGFTLLTGTADITKPMHRNYVDKVISYPGYKLTANNLTGDLAVVILRDEIPDAKPIELAESDPPGGVEALVTGWGRTEKNTFSDKLRAYHPYILTMEECYDIFKAAKFYVQGDNLCGAPSRKDGVEPGGACEGDSGGPLVYDNKIVGIVSFGAGDCGMEGSPTIYTSVATYRDWILEQVASIE